MTVTAGVKCYNNVRYIREALESAFSQTYRPLEIVISDDASTDGSWDVIKTVLSEHENRDGIRVVVNRNASNLGNLGNWEKICDLASGEFMVKFDGDDISEPNRVSVIAEAVKKAKLQNLHPTVVGHGGWLTRKNGRPITEMRPAVKGNHTGAAMAFSRECYTKFPKSVCSPKGCDDELYAWRGMMIGDFIEIPDLLVRYRIGTGVSNACFSIRRPMLRCATDLTIVLPQIRNDIAVLSAENRPQWHKIIDDLNSKVETRIELISASSIKKRIAAARRMNEHGYVWKFLKSAFVLPRPVGEPLLFAYAVLRHIFRILSK